MSLQVAVDPSLRLRSHSWWTKSENLEKSFFFAIHFRMKVCLLFTRLHAQLNAASRVFPPSVPSSVCPPCPVAPWVTSICSQPDSVYPWSLFSEQALSNGSTSYPSLGALLLIGLLGGLFPAFIGVYLLKSLGSGSTYFCQAPPHAPLSTCPALIPAIGTAFLDHTWPLVLATLVPQVP